MSEIMMMTHDWQLIAKMVMMVMMMVKRRNEVLASLITAY